MEPHNQSTLRQIKVVSIYVTYFIQGVYFRYSPFPHCLLFSLLVYLILENALLWKKNMQWFGVGKECYNSKEGIN